MFTRSRREHEVALLTRQGCHLCTEAHTRLDELAAEHHFAVRVVDVDEDPALRARYDELVPVVLVDGAQISQWVLDEPALLAALRR